MKIKYLVGLVPALLCNCAVLHHVQMGDVDNRVEFTKVPFEIMVSETTVSLKDIESIARSTHSEQGGKVGDAMRAIQYFQMGPRTGAPVYTEKYAEKLIYEIHSRCPSGMVTGVSSIRESRDYPVIKGEIVKVTGYCLRKRI